MSIFNFSNIKQTPAYMISDDENYSQKVIIILKLMKTKKNQIMNLIILIIIFLFYIYLRIKEKKQHNIYYKEEYLEKKTSKKIRKYKYEANIKNFKKI